LVLVLFYFRNDIQQFSKEVDESSLATTPTRFRPHEFPLEFGSSLTKNLKAEEKSNFMTEPSEQEQQELFYKFTMFEKQIRELQQQIEAIENGIVELNSLNFGLDELVGNVGKEIYAPLGKGIFVKAKLSSEEPNVDIGKGNLVKKSIPDTKRLIEEQIGKLEKIKTELENNLEEMGKEINEIINQTQPHKCHCKEGEECTCGDDCECEKE